MGKHVFEGGHARPEVPDLHTVLRRQGEQRVGAALVGHEDPHDVLFARVHREPGAGQDPAERDAITFQARPSGARSPWYRR